MDSTVKTPKQMTYDLETVFIDRTAQHEYKSCGLLYDSAAEQLIGATASTGEVFHIDVATGTALNHLSTEIPFEGVGVEYDPSTNSLLVSTGSLYRSISQMAPPLSEVRWKDILTIWFFIQRVSEGLSHTMHPSQSVTLNKPVALVIQVQRLNLPRYVVLYRYQNVYLPLGLHNRPPETKRLH